MFRMDRGAAMRDHERPAKADPPAIRWISAIAMRSALSISSLPRFFAAAEPHRLAVLKALWPAVTGETLANHSEVVGIQGDVMRIRADSGSWLKTLRDLKGTVIVRLQAAAGPLAPRALSFVEGPLTGRKPRKPRPRHPLVPDTNLGDDIREAANRIPTPEGRDIYLRAAAAFKGRFRKV
jgi:hypothetical protein